MKRPIDIKLVRFYLWTTLGFVCLWMMSDFHQNPETFLPRVYDNLWRAPYSLVVTFIFFEYTIPFVFRKRRYVIYNILLGLAALWIFMMLWSYGMYGWRQLGIALGIYTSFLTDATREHVVSVAMGYSMSAVFFFGVIRFIYNYVRLRQSQQQLKIEKQEAELNYLRSQTNPHFLFNTLNNIYSLTRDKSDLAPESILRLSKILRFMLYEAGGDYISIEQDLKILTDYIELEKLRYDESLHINFNYDVEDMKQAIPPLLLMPLVENAFKHGAAETRGRPSVDIHLSIRGRQLMFVVKNSTETFAGDERVKENIGLSNLRRQLELLYKDYDLSVQQGTSNFTSTLKINLASHV
ncbi:MAG TPA: histidine kinase [Chitinophagaceae bacterium]|nr:histidine kinase [Chitinophagaceae bacterium]